MTWYSSTGILPCGLGGGEPGLAGTATSPAVLATAAARLPESAGAGVAATAAAAAAALESAPAERVRSDDASPVEQAADRRSRAIGASGEVSRRSISGLWGDMRK